MSRARSVLRPTSLLLLSSTTFALAACGSDSGSGSGTGTAGGSATGGDDREAITKVVVGYAKAFADGDTAKACGYLSKGGLASVEEAAQQLGKDGCTDVLAEAAKSIDADARKSLDSIRVTSVDVSGDKAVVKTAVDSSAGATTTPANVVKEDGEWKIAADSPGGTATAQRATVTQPTMPSTITAP
jgi:hypothetical protein